tara:strand:+ start:23795 stop:25219 length:1425 start_codon:yes stop_codon:yes gene_type:complete
MNTDLNEKMPPDEVLVQIANYVCDTPIESNRAYETAKLCLMDSIGCAALALNFQECRKLLGPVIPETSVPKGVPVMGTSFCLDPIKATWDLGCMIRWLDFNDTWLAAEWGHPSDNFAAILVAADFAARHQGRAITMHQVLTYAIKAYEIQGVLALENSFNQVGLDHVILVKVASTAVATHLLGGTKAQVIDALSLAWVDGQSLRTYRHAPNAGSRKSWAAGDAAARAVQLAWITLKGEMGYPSALSAPHWGFYDVSFEGKAFEFNQGYSYYVMENILFKISYPAEFHAQTAVECAVQLHPQVKDRFDDIERIEVTTHLSAIRIISKTGTLNNPADRDHCLQYMIAVALLKADLTAEDYEDIAAQDERIDVLRDKMQIQESQAYSQDYLDPAKRSIANAIQIFFKDKSQTKKVECQYPIGHARRREEGLPLLLAKFESNLSSHYSAVQVKNIIQMFDRSDFSETLIQDFMKELKV